MPSTTSRTSTVASRGPRAVRNAFLRTTLAGAIVLSSLSAAPATAVASKLDTDRVAGVRLSSGDIPKSQAPDISARAGELIDTDGRFLWTRSSASRRPMASTTKVMTGLLALENADLDDVVKITKTSANVPYATGLKAGEKVTVRKLLELALVCSSNDAATALAIHVSGSVPAFARKMNARAAQLGLDDTHYANPHGLDARGHYTSATDLAKLIQKAMKIEEFRRIVAKPSVKFPGYKSRRTRWIKSTNQLLGVVEGMRGGKTGFTNDAKYCFVAYARRDGISLSSVVLGSPTSASRFKSSQTLLNWGFKHYKIRQLYSVTETAGVVPVSSDPQQKVRARFAETKSTPVFDLLGKVTRKASMQTNVTVPVYAGQKLGSVKIVQGTKVLDTVAAVAAKPKASAEETVGAVQVTGYPDKKVVAKAAPSTAAVAKYDTTRPVERDVDLDAVVLSPVAKGQKLGTITYRQDGRELVTVPAVAAEAVEAPGTLTQIGALIAYSFSLVIGG